MGPNAATVTVPCVKKAEPVKHCLAYHDRLGTESGADPLDTLWRVFHRQKGAVLGISDDVEEIGVTYPCSEEGYFCYFAGGTTQAAVIPVNISSWELPQGEYIVCSFEAENFKELVMDALYKAQQ